MTIHGDQHRQKPVNKHRSHGAVNPPNPSVARDPDGGESSSGWASRFFTLTTAVWASIVMGVVLVGASVVFGPTLLGRPAPAGGSSPTPGAAGQPGEIGTAVTGQIVRPQPVTAEALRALPQATTFGVLTTAPADPAPGQAPSGTVVHPADTVPVYATPGGPPIAALPPMQLGSDTWLPVVSERLGWVQVLLPTRPNGATGWLYLADNAITRAHSPYRIMVNRAAFTLRLLHNGHELGTWRVGVGKPGSVTPPGRTFVLGSIEDTRPTFSSIVLPLGAHSDTYQTYGGGPGTVGIHTWPSPEVYGTASSDGCVRIPPDALEIITSQVPLGTPVMIT